MAKLYITEFKRLGLLVEGGPAMIAPMPPLAEQAVDFTTGAKRSLKFNSATNYVRLHASGAGCSIKFGDAPTATAENLRMSAGQTEYFEVTQGQMISVIGV